MSLESLKQSVGNLPPQLAVIGSIEGGLAGGSLGALIGLLALRNKKLKGALIGGGIGAALGATAGGIAGYTHGKSEADKIYDSYAPIYNNLDSIDTKVKGLGDNLQNLDKIIQKWKDNKTSPLLDGYKSK